MAVNTDTTLYDPKAVDEDRHRTDTRESECHRAALSTELAFALIVVINGKTFKIVGTGRGDVTSGWLGALGLSRELTDDIDARWCVAVRHNNGAISPAGSDLSMSHMAIETLTTHGDRSIDGLRVIGEPADSELLFALFAEVEKTEPSDIEEIMGAVKPAQRRLVLEFYGRTDDHERPRHNTAMGWGWITPDGTYVIGGTSFDYQVKAFNGLRQMTAHN